MEVKKKYNQSLPFSPSERTSGQAISILHTVLSDTEIDQTMRSPEEHL